jgi:signal transduction histidine kinase
MRDSEIVSSPLIPTLHEGRALTVLRHVVATARLVARADGAAILLYDEEQDLFVPVTPPVAVGLDRRWLQRQGLAAAQTLALRAVQAHHVLDIPETAATPELEFPLLAGGTRPQAACAAPLEVEGHVVGVLELYDRSPRAQPVDHKLLQSFAALAGVAISAAKDHEKEQLLRIRLEALDIASKALASELSAERILRRIVEIATELVGARYGALGVVGADGYLTDFITTGLSSEERRRIGPLPRGHGLLGVLIRQGQPLRVPNMGRDPRRIGFPPNHPPMVSLLGVPIRLRQEVVGDLYFTDKIGVPEFSEEDQHLVELLAAHAGIAIENARLHAQLKDVTILRERDRIARDLHDGIIQDIYAATLQLEDVAEDVPDPAIRERLEGVSDHMSKVIVDIRTYIQGLRARELEGRLLGEGLSALVNEVNGRSGLIALWEVAGDAYQVPDSIANALLHITREALSNVLKHAQAGKAEVRLQYEATQVTLTISDDGRGFEPEALYGEEHHGLRNLRARTEEAGGTFSMRSTPGAGATLQVSIPAGT